jgi:hypothetical protein
MGNQVLCTWTMVLCLSSKELKTSCSSDSDSSGVSNPVRRWVGLEAHPHRTAL